jgi:hypothetical protein
LGSSSPQSFATFLRNNGAGKYFDGYSHHPYAVIGTTHTKPNQVPNDPQHTVTLGNINTLLKIFPGKAFYLTEYGYATRTNLTFGVKVTQAVQTQYLTKAYAMVNSNPRIVCLVWYLVSDWPGDPKHAGTGVYTGLISLTGAHKQSFAAFQALGQAASK